LAPGGPGAIMGRGRNAVRRTFETRGRCAMKKACLFAAALCAAAAVSGCQSARRAGAPAVVIATDADYDRLWDASLLAVGRRFEISKGEKDNGSIETAFLVGPLSETGLKTNSTGADAAYDLFQTIRRRAVVVLEKRGENPFAVRVEKERLIRVEPEPVPGGKFVLSHKRDVENYAARTRWTPVGRDPELEKTIAREIAGAYRHAR